jgi:hypothetical protein
VAAVHLFVIDCYGQLNFRLRITVTPNALPKLLGPDSWDGMRAYKITKLIQTHYAFALKELCSDKNVTSIALSPGQ